MEVGPESQRRSRPEGEDVLLIRYARPVRPAADDNACHREVTHLHRPDGETAIGRRTRPARANNDRVDLGSGLDKAGGAEVERNSSRDPG